MNDPDFWTKLVSGILLAATVSWITVNLTLRRTKKEVLWQKRFEAYSKILDALHVCRIKIDNDYYEEIKQHKVEWNSQQAYEPTSEQKEKLNKLKIEYQIARSELERIRTTGRLILPKEATEHLAETLKARHDDWQNMSSLEFLDTEEMLLKECINNIIKVARTDLR